jgi:DNA polymerase
MDEIRQEFLNIVINVRTHLEYQRALGMTALETTSQKNLTGQVPRNEVNPSASPLIQEGINESLQEAGEGRAASPSSALGEVRKELEGCNRCKLCNSRKSIVFGEGDPHARLVFVGEGPGQEEDQQGRPFVGAAGQLLTDIIVKGMSPRERRIHATSLMQASGTAIRNRMRSGMRAVLSRQFAP